MNIATTSTTKVLVVILNWNGIDDTLQCINSLSEQTFTDFRIAVVDNGSRDSSLDKLDQLKKSLSYKLIVIKNKNNLGFAGGVNSGIRYAIENSFEFVALFNNDASADKNWLAELVKHSDNNSVVTGSLLHSDGSKIDTSAEEYSTWGMPFPRGRDADISMLPPSGNVFGGTGGATLYKTSLFKEIGLFDEKFFAYYEDVDISFRAQLAGHKVYYTKDAVAYHKRGASSNKIPGFTVYQLFKNTPQLFWKNVPTKLLLPVGLRFLILYTAMFSKAVVSGSAWPALKGFLASIYYFWTSALWKRIKIQHNKKVSADYIWSILYHDLPPEQTGMRKFRKLFTGKE